MGLRVSRILRNSLLCILLIPFYGICSKDHYADFRGVSHRIFAPGWYLGGINSPDLKNSSSHFYADLNYVKFNAGDAGDDQELCNVTTTNLNAQIPGGSWSTSSPGAIITDPSSPTTAVSNLNVGDNTFIWTVGVNSDDVVITVLENPTMAVAGTDQSICGSTTVLEGNPPSVGAGVWTITSGSGGILGDPSSPSSSFDGVVGITYELTWTISNGTCTESADIVEVSFNATPNKPTLSSDDPIICFGTTAVGLESSDAPTGGSYRWYKDGVLTADVNQNLTLVDVSASGTYEVEVVQGTLPNCVSERSDPIEVIIEAPPEAPTITTGPTGNIVCDGETVTLTSSPPPANGSYAWFRGTSNISNNPTISIATVGADTYTARVLSEQGCISPSSAEEIVAIEPLPATPGINTSGSTICGDGLIDVTLTSSSDAPDAGTYIWYRDEEEVVGGVSKDLVLSNPGETGNYTVQVVDGDGANCRSEISAVEFVEIFQLPSAPVIGADIELCETTTTNLNAQTPTVGIGTWTTSSPGVVITDPNSPTSSISGLSVGSHTFSWQIDNGACIGSPQTLEIEVFAAPSPAVAEADKVICDATSTTISADPIAVGIGEWQIISGSGTIINPNSISTTITELVPNTAVLLSWTVSNGNCSSEQDQLEIQVSSSPSPAFVSDDQQLCDVSATSVQADSPLIGSGVWSLVSGSANIQNPNDPATDVTNLQPGDDVVLRWTVSNICGSNRTDLTIQNERAPDIANAGLDIQLCGTTTANLEGSGANGTWTVVSGSAIVADANDPNSSVSDLALGTNVLRYSIPGSFCEGTEDEVIITVFEEPSAADIGSDLVFCAGENLANISAIAPVVGQGQWSIESGSGNIVNSNSPSTQINGLQSGETVLLWTVSNGACSSNSDRLSITVYPEPALNQNRFEICRGESVEIEAVGGDRYAWTPSTGLSATNLANPVANPVESTTYLVDVIRDNCTSGQLEVVVDVKPTPSLSISEDTTIFANEQVQLQVSGAESYQWSPEETLDNPESDSPVATPSNSTIYTVVGTNEFDCSATEQVNVFINENFQVFVPDLFSPNGDDANDMLLVNTLGINSLQFRIYDRRGKEIFTTNDKSRGWDGTFNGVDQPMDSYIYYVVAETSGGQRISQKGSVQLVR